MFWHKKYLEWTN